MYSALPWLYANPHIVEWHITPEHIDHYNHVNNVAYISQIETLAWSHSNHLGLGIEHYRELDRAMVIHRHEIDYLAACHLGDILACATWIVDCDNKLSLTRQFEFICAKRKKPVFRAKTQYICVSLLTGAPKRMPASFIDIYGNALVPVE